MVNIVFLKTFVSLAKTKSFRATAHLNFITQSAVSQQIRVLESKLKCKLIERSNKNVSLTHEGKIFLEHAEKILDQYEGAVQEINDKANSYKGTIKIATIYSIGLYKLQPIIRSFLKKYPEINIYLEYYHNDFIYEKIINQTIDFGFVAFPNKKSNVHSNVVAEEDMVLIQSVQRPVFKTKQINTHDLNNSKFVSLSHTTPTGKEINNVFKKMSLSLNIIHEFENVETLKSAVIIGMGCALIPKNSVTSELQTKLLEIVHIKDFNFKRPIGILKSKNRNLPKSKQIFYDLILSKADVQFSTNE